MKTIDTFFSCISIDRVFRKFVFMQARDIKVVPIRPQRKTKGIWVKSVSEKYVTLSLAAKHRPQNNEITLVSSSVYPVSFICFSLRERKYRTTEDVPKRQFYFFGREKRIRKER